MGFDGNVEHGAGLQAAVSQDEASRGDLRVMAALVAAIHAFARPPSQDVDGRDEPGHDAGRLAPFSRAMMDQSRKE